MTLAQPNAVLRTLLACFEAAAKRTWKIAISVSGKCQDPDFSLAPAREAARQPAPVATATGLFISRSDCRTVVPSTTAAPMEHAARKANDTAYDAAPAMRANNA